MLNIKKYMIMVCALLSLNGCDYLDYDHTTGKTKEEAYAYYENMNQLVAYVYTFLPSDLGSGYIMESATDNCIYTQENAGIYYMTDRCMESLEAGWTTVGTIGPVSVVPILSLRILTLKY